MGKIIGVIKLHGERDVQKRGDILQTRLPSFKGWSDAEQKDFQLVELNSADNPLIAASEERLLKQKADGEPVPLDESPFADYAIVSEEPGQEIMVMKSQSTIQIDINALSSRKKADVLNRNKKVAALKKRSYKTIKVDPTDRRV